MKIRLAKHTRALAAALAFCVLSAVPAYAQEDDTVEVPLENTNSDEFFGHRSSIEKLDSDIVRLATVERLIK